MPVNGVYKTSKKLVRPNPDTTANPIDIVPPIYTLQFINLN